MPLGRKYAEMIRPRTILFRSAITASILGAAFFAGCSDDGDSDQNVGDAGTGGTSSAGAGGDGGSATGGNSSGGNSSGGSTTGGSSSGGNSSGGSMAGGSGGSVGGSGGSGGATSEGNPDEVVEAACGWEFRCCDEGEIDYRLSPFATDTASCTSRFVFQMRQSNATDNPYFSGSGAPNALLGTLGYVVDLTRVSVSASGVDECVAALDAQGCAVEADPDARCDGPGSADPCALDNLFDPVLEIGDECTADLTEAGLRNDIECVAGSTCLPATHPDNPNNVPTCVKRGREDEPCTADDDCDFNFYCGGGSCTEKSDVDETCSFNDPDSPAPNDEDVQCKAGLSCHPLQLKCVAACSLGSVCAITGDADLACPANTGCAPLEVDESTATYRTCQAVGESSAALCNSDDDCASNRYCDGTNCQADKIAAANCAEQKECATGLHCDINNTGTCVTNLAALSTCTDDFQCGPNSAGCLDGGTDGLACRNNLLANGDTCGTGEACQSGRCEFANASATDFTCVPGAGASAACDSQTGDGDAQSCAPGLLCFGETGDTASGTCVTKALAGADCNNPDGDADDDMCANASTCEDVWNEGEMCTDAPIAKAEGGTGLVCDGNGS